jgi:hypothetical protein
MPYELPDNVDRIYGQERPRYYVMRIGGGPPRKPYGSRFKAEEDAVKLAGENPGAEFAVVKVKSIFKSNAIVATAQSDVGEQVPDGIAAEQVVPA